MMTYIIVKRGSALLCGRCGRISHLQADVEHRYCDECKLFHQEAASTEHDRLLEHLINALIDQQPDVYTALAARIRDGAAFDAILDGYIRQIDRVGGNLYNVAYLTTEWLLEQRAAAQRSED